MFEALHLALIEPALVILWEYISGRSNVVILSVRALHAEHIPPQVVFSAKMPSTREMIDFLILVYILKLVGLDQSSPQKIPSRS